MRLLRSLLTFPVAAPAHGVTWIAAKIHEAAVAELHDPAQIKRALVALEADLDAGRIDEPEFEAAELILLQRLQAARA